ncbi:hypothetical protein CC80DRAFT_509173 [Byssothecium circinans]|uniref:HMG box domain-containing protein n=1 Tax=Byssothecium circinans TaxID=147558 RepID=A0A6A5TEK8_9PLEO|nr:hypothetical protein CC80DRAFT_509173 [Byssothecium circinans]
MLASRVLPPILHRRSSPQLQEVHHHHQVLPPLPPPPSRPVSEYPFPAAEVHDPVPPVATFFSIPRRYFRSNMQNSGNASQSSYSHQMGNVKPSLSPRSLRKSSRIHELRSASTSSSVDRTTSSKDDLPSPASASSPRTTKKRYESFGDEIYHNSAGHGNDGEGESPTGTKPPNSASSTGSGGELSGHVCLCQPEPKIPRPRNAFILYRQHHQHAIVARNPGLANPEISKIIGEQWKAESDESKKVWQNLAQEEKLRHHEQYPDYRYQPRRLGKPGSLLLNTTGHTTVDKYRCPRCGGRSIKTPTSPFPSTPTLPPPNESSGLTPTTTRYLPMMSNLSLDSPIARRVAAGRTGPGPSGLSNIQVTNTTTRDDAPMYSASPLTPGTKRRRYNEYPPGPPTVNGRRSDTPYYAPSHYHPQQQQHHQQQRRDSLPPIQMRTIHSPPSTAGMPPPPRTPRDARRASVDLNLLVPPPQHHDQSRSVEAMVMSVPYSVKIKVLGRITPPLKDPGPSSPSVAVRGAIVAVEGDDLEAVGELTEWLRGFLGRDRGEFRVRVEEPPRGPGKGEEVKFEEYLDLVREWHGRSREMVRFITTALLAGEEDTGSMASSSSAPTNNTGDNDEDKNDDDEAPTTTTATAEKDKDKDTPMNPPSSSPSTTSTPTPSSPQPTPVILLPTYQLHASDTYASKIPIQDVYSPMDHWQWMATLWRGTVGPDLTIYVKSEGKEGNDRVGSGGAVNGNGNGNGGREKAKVVEVNEEGKFLTVVRENGAKGFREAALRRVGFEVGEWVRGLGR